MHGDDYKAWSYSKLNAASSSELRKKKENIPLPVVEVKDERKPPKKVFNNPKNITYLKPH